MPHVGQPFNPYKLFVGSFLPNALLEFPRLSPSAKLVWARLSQYAGLDGKCHPKVDTLASEVALSGRQVINLLNELVKQGFLRKIKSTGSHRLLHFPDDYVFLWHECFGQIFPSGHEVDFISGNEADFISNTRESLQDILPRTSDEASSYPVEHGQPFLSKRKKPPADPHVKVVIDHYYQTYLARFKSPPPIAGGKCGMIAKRLLAGRSLDDALWLITAHLDRAPEMYERKNLYGLEHILHAAPVLLARRAKDRGEYD